jgi:PIN domain nuclease of toxin-antitoxin system
MRLLLDTNVFIKILEGRLPAKVERRIFKPGAELLLSIVSPWEIAIKRTLHKAGFTAHLVQAKIAELGLQILPVRLEHTARVYSLPLHHNEPFDRMIIAQALVEDCPLVSSDQRFPLYSSTGLKVLWAD